MVCCSDGRQRTDPRLPFAAAGTTVTSMDRDRTPLAAAAATAVFSCALLALAVGSGWLGADAGRGAGFCEAGRDWAVRQPANSFSNVGFVLAAADRPARERPAPSRGRP